MKTKPSEAELELERTRQTELRLEKYHIEQKDPIAQAERAKARQENQDEALQIYTQHDNKLYKRLVQLEVKQ